MSILNLNEPTPVSTLATPSLATCIDCGRSVSTHADDCPGCGRVFKRYAVTVDRTGWAWTIAGGILLVWVLSVALSIVIVGGLFLLGIMTAVAGMPR